MVETSVPVWSMYARTNILKAPIWIGLDEHASEDVVRLTEWLVMNRHLLVQPFSSGCELWAERNERKIISLNFHSFEKNLTCVQRHSEYFYHRMNGAVLPLFKDNPTGMNYNWNIGAVASMYGLIAQTIPLPSQSNIWWFDDFCFKLCRLVCREQLSLPRVVDLVHDDMPPLVISFAKYFMHVANHHHESVFNFASVRIAGFAFASDKLCILQSTPNSNSNITFSHCQCDTVPVPSRWNDNNGWCCDSGDIIFLSHGHRIVAFLATTHQKRLARRSEEEKTGRVVNMPDVMCNKHPSSSKISVLLAQNDFCYCHSHSQPSMVQSFKSI